MNAKETEQKINIEELLSQGKTVLFHPQGTSMWPLFVGEADTATVTGYDAKKAKRGDVWIYRRPNGPLVIHRVFKVSKEGVWFVGDHQTQKEGPIPFENLRGKMVAFCRKNKEYTVSNLGYRMLSSIWLFLRPFRWGLIHTGSFLKRLIH